MELCRVWIFVGGAAPGCSTLPPHSVGVGYGYSTAARDRLAIFWTLTINSFWCFCLLVLELVQYQFHLSVSQIFNSSLSTLWRCTSLCQSVCWLTTSVTLRSHPSKGKRNGVSVNLASLTSSLSIQHTAKNPSYACRKCCTSNWLISLQAWIARRRHGTLWAWAVMTV